MSGDKSMSWLRIGRAALIIVIAGWAAEAVVVHFWVWRVARTAAEGDSESLRIVPTALPDTTVANLSGVRLSKFGFSFQVPWDGDFDDRMRSTPDLIKFDNGASLMVFDPSGPLLGERPRDRNSAVKIFPSATVGSNYGWTAACVWATPEDVRWWDSRLHNMRAFLLLENKRMDMLHARSIHAVSAGVMRGFQFGDPDPHPTVLSCD
jgi:hypothetical protein